MPSENLKKLHSAVSAEYDLPSIEVFEADMQDEGKRKKFYEAVSAQYELPEYNTFIVDMGFGEKKNSVTTEPLSDGGAVGASDVQSTESETGLFAPLQVPKMFAEKTLKVKETPAPKGQYTLEREGQKANVNRDDIFKSLDNPEFLQGIKSGEVKIDIQDDEALGNLLNEKLNFFKIEEPKFNDQEISQIVDFYTTPSPMDILPDRLKQATNSFLNAIGQGIASIPKSAAILSKKLDFFDEYKNKEAKDLATYKAGEYISNLAQELFPTNPTYQEEFFSTVLPSGAGSLVSQIAGGLVSPTAPLLIGSSSMGSSEYEQALAQTGDEEKAFDAWKWNSLIGTSEAILPMLAISKIDKATGGGIKNVLKEGFKGSLTEGLQEAGSQIATNFTAKQIYDSSREILNDDVWKSGAAGAILGGFTTGAITAINQKIETAEPKEKEELKNVKTFLEKKAAEAESGNYTPPTTTVDAQIKDVERDIVNPEIPEAAKQVLNENLQSLKEQRKTEVDKIIDSEFNQTIIEAKQEDLSELEASKDKLSDANKLIIDEKIKELENELKELVSGTTTTPTVSEPIQPTTTTPQEQGVEETVSESISEVGDGTAETTTTVLDPLKDVESTAKALEGKNIENLSRKIGVEPSEKVSESEDFETATKAILTEPNKGIANLMLGKETEVSQKQDVHTHTYQKTGRTLNWDLSVYENSKGQKRYVLYERKYPEQIDAAALVDKDGKVLQITTSKDFRKIGLAQTLLSEIKSDIGKIIPSEPISKAGKKALDNFARKQISEAYHKAKQDGSNPELVKAVEELLTPKIEQDAKEQQSGQMREQSVQETTERTSDSDMPIVNEAELQDREVVEKNFTESKDLNRIFKAAKEKYGEKEGSKYNDVANRLVNPNQNTIIEVRSNGIVVKRGNKYLLLPFTNTDANYKKWELASRPLDVTEQYVPIEITQNIEAVEEKVGVPPTPPIEPTITITATENPKEVKKTVQTKRAYEGQFREEVKSEIEKYGLTREVENQELAEQRGKDFVNAVGVDAAFEAVKNGDISGAMAAAVLAEAMTINEGNTLISVDDVEIARLNELQGQIIDLMGKIALEGGRYNAMLNRIYQTSDLGFNAERKIQEYKALNNGEISPELEQKFRDLDAQLKDVNKRLAEAEQRAKQAEEKATIEAIKQAAQRDKEAKRTYKQRAKKVADEFRKLKTKPPTFTDANGNVIDITQLGIGWNELVEIGAKAIELSGELADGVKAISDKLKEQDWYAKLSVKDREAILKQVEEYLSPQSFTEGDIKISTTLLKDLVEGGIDNINDLVIAVQEQTKDQYPNATERQIRDAITGYGKISSLSQDEIDTKLRKMRRLGKLISQLEDIREKKRPLRSGQQRDKLDAEERAKMKEVREAMKDLPMDEADIERQLKTAQDATKTRLQNQIEDLEREIERGEKVPRNVRTVKEDDEIKSLKERRDKLKAESDKLFKDEEFINAKRLEAAKKRTQNSINDLERRLREGDFEKKKPTRIIADDELTKLKAEKIRIKEEFDKEFYKVQLKNRTKFEQWKDRLWEAWNLPRMLMATGEFSFVLIQGLKLSLGNPKLAVKSFKNAMDFFKSEKKSEEWLRDVKSQPYYPIAKESKLALTDFNAELTAREELFYSGWTNWVWNNLGMVLLTPVKLRSQQAYEKAVSTWENFNPFKATERAAVGYLDMLRLQKFLDGMEKLEQQGKTIDTHKQDYKDVADVINTLTGRASLGKAESFAPELSKLFFSPRNWASGFKTGTPYALFHFGRMTPTARKLALLEMSKFLGITTSMVALVAAYMNNDDDDETEVEFDPRSTDFMKIRMGNTRVDPWGGMQQQVVLSTRIILDWIMKGFVLFGAESPIKGAIKKNGEIFPLGIPNKTKKGIELAAQQAINKFNPTMSLVYNFADTKIGKEGTLKDDYGNEYLLSEELAEKSYPIFWQTVEDLLKDDPSALDGLLSFYAFFGGGVAVYEDKKKQTKKQGSTLGTVIESDVKEGVVKEATPRQAE